MLSPDLQRIKHICDYCNEIEKTIARYGNSFEIFDHDPDYQRSIPFSIMQIGELSGGLSENYRKATSNRVQWGPMKGMRNMVAHSYGNMNREIIWETASVDIPALKGFCLEQLADQDGSGIRINDNYCISVTKLSQNSVQRNDYRKSIKHRSVFPPFSSGFCVVEA